MIAIFPEITHCAASGDIERLGVLVREYFGGPEKFSPRLSVATVLENLGIRVVRSEVDGVGALLASDQKGVFSVTFVLTNEPLAFDQRFLLAHLFGHYLLHVQPYIARGDWAASGFREYMCASERFASTQAEELKKQSGLASHEWKRETDADHFAAAMLLPKGMVLRAMARLQDVSKAAKFFSVSESCLARRLEQLSDAAQQPANFLQAEAQLEPKTKPTESTKTLSRAAAATSYQNTAKITIRPKGSAPTGAEGDKAEKPRGMERLRQLAKMLDKGV